MVNAPFPYIILNSMEKLRRSRIFAIAPEFLATQNADRVHARSANQEGILQEIHPTDGHETTRARLTATQLRSADHSARLRSLLD